MGRLGWEIDYLGKNYVYVKKLPLVGSVVKVQRPEKLGDKEISEIKRIEKKHRAFHIIVEPKNVSQGEKIKTHGFRLGKSAYLPTKTLHLDLTQSKDDLLNLISKDAKYCLRKAGNLRIYTVDDVSMFSNSWNRAVSLKDYRPTKNKLHSLRHAFRENCQFITTPSGSAGAIFLKTKDSVYYWQAFTSSKGRAELAQYKIVWAVILQTKKEGLRHFDFEGIYDDRFPNKGWLGFSHFKKSFGGHEICYPGAFSKFQFPL